jgi:hypothetical protein
MTVFVNFPDRPSCRSVLLWTVVVLMCCVPSVASGQNVALSARGSTLGIGPEVTVELASVLNLRGGASYLPLHRRGLLQNTVNVRYDVQARLAAVHLFLDWHPFGNAFRMSGGAVYNRSQAQLRASPAENVTMNGRSFSPDQLGHVSGSASFSNAIHPYLGIGLGNAVQGSRIDVFADAGAMYVGRPHVEMDGEGFIKGTANHASALNEGFRSFRILPYLSLGFSVDL